MKKIIEQFASSDLKDWKNKISNELKGKTISYLDNIALDSSPVNLNKNIQTPTNWQLWKSCESIEIINIKDSKEIIKNALEGGIESLNISVHQEISSYEINALFENVILDIIEINFDFESEIAAFEVIESFKTYLDKKGYNADKIKGRIIYTSKLNYPVEFSKVAKKQLNAYKTICISNKEEDLIKSLESYVKKINSCFQNGEPGIENKIFFKIDFEENFLENIIKVKSLKILWETLCKAYELPKTEIDIFVRINSNLEENTDIIDATSQAVAAALVGVSSIDITPSKFKDEKFARRISRNIHHLLKFESKFNQIKDITAGTYLIENISLELSQKVWKNFTK